MAPQINFSPLEQKGHIVIGQIKINTGIIITVFIASAVLCMFFLPKSLHQLKVGLSLGFISLAFAVIVIQSIRDKKIWRRFASVNNWQILPAKSGVESAPPSVKDLGHSQTSSEVVVGKLNNQDFNVHTFQYTTGSGKTSTTHESTILSLKLPVQAPHLLLAHNKLLREAVNIFQGAEKLPLEGDFNQYFSLYCPKGSEVEALQILTPDIMSFLIGADKQYNIEFFDGWLYACAYGDVRDPNKLKELFSAVVSTSSQLLQNYNLSHAPKV